MREQLEAVVEAAKALLAAPDAVWSDGMTSAEWYRRCVARRDAINTFRVVATAAFDATRVEMVVSDGSVDAARGAVLEDATRGDIP